MTYIDLINDFWREFENEALRPNDAMLYLYLLKTCNSKGWENPFELSNKRVRLCLEIKDKAIIESRERLIERGLIEVEKGERNRTAPVYKLIRLCFPSESKKKSKKASNNESKRGDKEKAERKQNGSKNGNIIIDKDLDYYVVDEITREDFFNDFFSPERQATVEQLCMARAFGSVENFKRLARAVLSEWEALPEPKHSGLKDARQHLINHCSRKMSAELRDQQNPTTQKNSNNGTRDSNIAPTKHERTEVFASHIIDKLTRPNAQEFDDGFD